MNKSLIVLSFFTLMFIACKPNSSSSTSTKSTSSSSLFDEYFDLFPQASFAQPGGLNLEREAFMLYNAKHTDKAAIAFQDLYDQHHFPRHKFYAAISNLAEDKVDLAIQQLEDLDQEGKLSMKFVHQYFLGLAYLKAGRKADAKAKLGELKDNFQHYKKKAEALIQKI